MMIWDILWRSIPGGDHSSHYVPVTENKFNLSIIFKRLLAWFQGVYWNQFWILAFEYAYLAYYTVLSHNQEGYYNSLILHALELLPERVEKIVWLAPTSSRATQWFNKCPAGKAFVSQATNLLFN